MKPRILILAMAAMLFAGVAHAGGFGNFTHYERGFYLNGTVKQNDGWWWRCSNGRFYRHSQFRQQQAKAQAQVQYSANWKSDLVKALDKQRDHELFLQALRESGLQSNQQGYSNGNDYSATSGSSTYSYGYVPFADQGGTIYGATVKDYAPNIGQVDVAALVNQQMRLVERLSEGTNTANNAVAGQINSLANAQAEVAKIQAAGQVLVETVRAAQAPATAHHTWQRETQSQQQSQPQALSAPQTTATDMVRVAALFERSCVKCHGAEKAQGGLNLSGFDSWGTQQRAEVAQAIMDRITSQDPEMRMPPPPADPVGVEDLRALMAVFP